MNKKFIKNLIYTILILAVCTLLSMFMIQMKVRIENVVMIYLIGVLFIMIQSRNFIWGLTAGALSIVAFNYFFTQPTFSLEIYDRNYVITIFIFLMVSCITAFLIHQLQKHIQIARQKEVQMRAFYEISKDFFQMNNVHNIIQRSIQALFQNHQIISIVYYYDTDQKKLLRFEDESIQKEHRDSEDALAKWCFDNRCDCGYGTSFYAQKKWTYRPLMHKDEILGVHATWYDKAMSIEQEMFISTILSQMVIAIEREHLFKEREQNRVEIEKEKLRNSLLRSISHDLRTPLTGIAGSASLIVNNFESIQKESIYALAKNISNDAVWLEQLVENLLNMTRIQDGKLIIKKQKEVVDDVICEAMQVCDSRKGRHRIEMKLPKEVTLVRMDGKLIVQVLINLIDNAIKHTNEDSYIRVQCYRQAESVYFEVLDHGDGIDPLIQDKLFESFETTKNERSDSHRGIGLGLSICRSIIEAHHGTIYAYNQEHGKGAVFGFQLPLEEDIDNE